MVPKNSMHIKGHDAAGDIVKLEEGVTGLKAGHLVATFTKTATEKNRLRYTFSFW